MTLFVINWLGVFLVVFASGISTISHKYVNITGDFIIGGLFPVHEVIGGGRCSPTTINVQDGIQNVEAFIYMLQKINREGFLPGFTLGTIIEDTCYSDIVALEKALGFVRRQVTTVDTELHYAMRCKDGSSPIPLSYGQFIGVVGAAVSSVSIQLASFFRLFKIPQVSYMSTSPELNDAKRYGYFLRTVPSDVYQARAIVEILEKFRWSYASIIYEDTSYGIQGYTEILNQSRSRDICLAFEKSIKRYFDSEASKRKELEKVVRDLNTFNNTNGKVVVIVFASFDLVRALFDIVAERGEARKFIWIGSDAWSGRIFETKAQKSVAENCLGVQLLVRKVPEFDAYFSSLIDKTEVVNPWFPDYVQQCKERLKEKGEPVNDLSICSTLDDVTRNLNTYTTMDALLVYAHALKNAHRDICGKSSTTLCPQMKNISGEKLLPYLREVSFTDPAGLNFSFVAGRNGPARYSINTYVRGEGDDFRWVEIGQYIDSSGNSTWDTADYIVWNETVWDTANTEPSRCSEECAVGQFHSRRENNPCCWTCVSCGEYEYSPGVDEVCKSCKLGEKPNSFKNACAPIPEEYMSYGNVWAIVSLSLSVLGMTVTVLVGIVFYINKETPVIMASGKELSFVLLGGIFFSFLSSFVFVAYPTGFTCGATRVMLGLLYTLCYAAILVKTNRIYRVFNIQTNKPKKVRFTSAKSQLLITFALVMVEVAVLTAWLVFKPPTFTYIYPTRGDNIRVCMDSTDVSYLGALVYPFLLMVLCIVYAIRTRKTPDGFNETTYIAFGSYSFCIMWLAFVPVYFFVTNNTIRIISLCLASVVNASVTLITLFVTKAYIVIFQPQKNTKENVMSRRRMHTYDTVDLNNLSNISRLKDGAVSTWHSSYNASLQGSEGPSSPRARSPSFLAKYGQELNVSVISGAAISKSDDSIQSEASASSAPEAHSSAEEAKKFNNIRNARQSNSDGDLLEHDAKHITTNDSKRLSNGHKHKFSRFTSFKPKTSKKFHVSNRPSSMDIPPTIIMTVPSEEDVARL